MLEKIYLGEFLFSFAPTRNEWNIKPQYDCFVRRSRIANGIKRLLSESLKSLVTNKKREPAEKSILLSFFFSHCFRRIFLPFWPAFIFSFINLFVINSQTSVWADGLSVPASSSVNVNSGTLDVPGNVTNLGTIQVSTGRIKVGGNWDNSSGTYTSGTGTTEFTKASATQTLNSGGTAVGKKFYNLTHSGAGTLQFNANDLDLDGSFSNTAGTVNANGKNMTVGGNWANTGTFTAGSNSVVFDGANQSISGSTTFYDFAKTVTSAATLTLPSTLEQIVTHHLTLQGAAGQLLTIKSDVNGSQHKITLQSGGLQTLSYLNVNDSDASNGLALVAGATSVNTTPGTNVNWIFGATTITWTGNVSTDWDTPGNWNLGLVPGASDAVVIPNVATQPILATNVTIATLTINSSATLTLNGKNLTVTGALSNDGTVSLFGSETVNIGTVDPDSGTFLFTGDNDGISENFTIPDLGAAGIDYFNVVINDTSGVKDTFRTNANLTIAGALTVTAGTIDVSTNSNTLTTAGTLTVNGGTLTATNGNIDANGAVVVSSGTLTAPTIGKTFTVAGNFTHSGGTFTNSSGTLTLDGTSQSINGSTTFYNLAKTVASTATLTFESSATQTVTNNLTLQGASGQLLVLAASTPTVAANLILQSGGSQNISYVNVADNNANGGTTLVGRNGSVNSNGNSNWLFGAQDVTWTGTSSTDWDTASNWDLGFVPGSTDSVIIPSVATQPVLATNVTVLNLTLQASATLDLNGKNMTVSGTLDNSGNVRLFGSESVSINVPDTNSGTFTYLGNGDGIVDTDTIANIGYYNLTINDSHATPDVFQTNADLTVNGALTVTGGTMDISANANTLTTTGALTVNGGTLTATNGNIDANNSVTVSSGTLTAPGAGKNFTVAGNFAHSGGTFTNSNGTVTLDTTTTATISGNTTFYNLTVTTPAKEVDFTAGTTQTVTNNVNFTGDSSNDVILHSTSNTGVKWDITFPNGTQSASYVSVKDSNANSNTITCFSCTNGGNNNANWIFSTLSIAVPANGKTVGQTPTIIGVAPPNTAVTIKDISNNTVATVTSDANGNFRVASSTLALGANSLKPSAGILNGVANSLTVVASPTTSQVPTITSHNNGDRVNGSMPTIRGQGNPSSTLAVLASNGTGSFLLQTVGTGTVDASGNYEVTLTTALPKGTNYLSVTIDNVATSILNVALTDPFGVVFDSSTGQPIKNAVVTIYNSTGAVATPGVELDASDTNPYTTGADGYYSFLAANGDYTMTVSATGYDYPSTQTSFPSSRTVTTGSKGETFTVAGVILQIDHPMDANGQLLRIEKSANKKEVHVGEPVTYTVTMQNISTSDVSGVILEDKIPPGFKFIPNRVILDGNPIADTQTQRPVTFHVGNFVAGTTKTLKYQLIVGSGVTPGNYDNVAVGRNANQLAVSNRASASVKVVLDPLFDMGAVIGKVFWDKNENGVQDPPTYFDMDRETITETSIPNAQIIMEDGTMIRCDQNGQFSVPGITPGRHLFRIDESTLPDGAYLTTDKVVIVDITKGLTAKVNFGVQLTGTTIQNEQDFFVHDVNLIQDKSKPQPRLNVSLFKNQVVIRNDTLSAPAEFRIFTNYAPFIDSWKLEIRDKQSGRLIRAFTGDRSNISDPIYWDGKDQIGKMVLDDRHYAYKLTVADKDGNQDETSEQPFDVLVTNPEKEKFVELTKTILNDKNKSLTPETNQQLVEAQDRVIDYRQWLANEYKGNRLVKQTIKVDGETVFLDRYSPDVRSVRVIKTDGKSMTGKKEFYEVPIVDRQGLTATELIKTPQDVSSPTNKLEIILPKGNYEIQVQEGSKELSPAVPAPNVTPLSPPILPPDGIPTLKPLPIQTYSKKVKVGEDYMMFVGMGDAKIGYTFDRSKVEDVAKDDQYKAGFWSEGKLAYFLKGKILGKYLVTSSFDSNREQKEIFKNINPNQYYPIYGDNSSKDYSATNTQGKLYLLVEWDKSSVIWGNYNVGFTDTEFAQYNRSLYGGKIDYQTVAATPYGEPDTRVVLFRAKAQQKGAHNEFVGTGGSLFYLKNKDVIEGSEKVSVQIRDKITGLVISSRDMKPRVDYEIDYKEGRILFWKPVNILVEGASIISSQLLSGNPVYVLTDYEYEPSDDFQQATIGARVAQAVSDNVVVGGTYVKENQQGGEYNLKATDTTVHLGHDATIKGEYAESQAQATGTFVSTDGGLTFTELQTNQDAQGKAYGLRGDARLFNRIGLTSYYKWIDDEFSTPATTAQQGKELEGVALDYEISPKTRLSMRHDVQRLLDSGNAQTQLQVGASRTETTSMQIVHQIRQLTLTGEYRHQQVTDKNGQFVSETNTQGDLLALKADYAINDNANVYLERQQSIQGPSNAQTTVGGAIRPDKTLELRASETIAENGNATSLGATKNFNDKVKIAGDYTIVKNNAGRTSGLSGSANQGSQLSPGVNVSSSASDKDGAQASLGADIKLTDKTSVQGALGLGQTVSGEKTTTLALGGRTKVDSQTDLGAKIGMTQSSSGGVGETLGADATRQVDDTTQVTSGVDVSQRPGESKMTNFKLGGQKQLTDEVKMTSERSFGFSRDIVSQNSSYGMIREKDGHKLQGTITRQHSEGTQETSDSNIYGLSGDVGSDKFALNGSYERGIVQSHNGQQSDRNAVSVGMGYVDKDKETGVEKLKASSKIEFRKDSGDTDKYQYVLYNSAEGRLTPEISIYLKTQLSKTENTSSNNKEAEYKEIILGGAYRPIYADRLNILGRYTYLTNLSPDSQSSNASVDETRAHVFAGEVVYDLTPQWQLSEKLALRLNEERVPGFDFTQTQTWLMIHRLNYNIAKDWQVSGEYRRLAQIQAKDSQSGFLLEVSRDVNDFAQLGAGWNFTQFSDDLTDLGYTAQGPFLRMTTKLYDRTPQEKALAHERWLQDRINIWAWDIINRELVRPDSPIVEQLNEFFAMAKQARAEGNLEEAQKIYKDIIVAGDIMFNEASQYILGRVSFEEKLQDYASMANEHFKQGEYEEAKKLWQKILEETEKPVVK